jgi:hypothetical protein
MAPRPDAPPQIAMVLPRINAVFGNVPIPTMGVQDTMPMTSTEPF